MNGQKNTVVLSLFLFITIFLFCCWSAPDLIPKTSPDSWGYLNLANNFNDEVSKIRPFFFPLLIKLCMNLSELYWQQLFSIIQIFFHAVICIFLFQLFLELQLHKTISLLMTLIIGFNPSLVFYTTYVLADHLLAVLTTLAWICTINSVQNYRKNYKLNWYMILTAIFSGLAVVTKPIAILGILPLIFTFIIISKKSIYIIKPIILILIINFSFYLLWEKYKDEHNPATTFELLDSIEYSINMTAIRVGLVDYGIGTPLYNEIKRKALLDRAREFRIKISYTMDDNPEYWKFNKSLSWEIKNEKES